MTPPDSDEEGTMRYRHVGKPDSGEREVQHVVAAAFEYCRVDGEVAVHVPLLLAQRILAALDAAASDYERLKVYGAIPVRVVATELRERLPKLPKEPK